MRGLLRPAQRIRAAFQSEQEHHHGRNPNSALSRLVCSDFISAEEFAEVVEPSELVVQYCIRDQALLDRCLRFVRTETVATA